MKILACSRMYLMAILLLILPTTLLGMESTHYAIRSSVFAASGTPMISTAHSLKSSMTQPSPVSRSSSNQYSCYSGFWGYLYSVLLGDVNGDYDVDLVDIVISLKVIANSAEDDLKRTADVNGDGKIGLEEAVFILRKLSGNL